MNGMTEIKIEGHLDSEWVESFEGMTIRHADNLTILQVRIKDQAHLHGILNLLRDLNLKLVSINSPGA